MPARNARILREMRYHDSVCRMCAPLGQGAARLIQHRRWIGSHSAAICASPDALQL